MVRCLLRRCGWDDGAGGMVMVTVRVVGGFDGVMVALVGKWAEAGVVGEQPEREEEEEEDHERENEDEREIAGFPGPLGCAG